MRCRAAGNLADYLTERPLEVLPECPRTEVLLECPRMERHSPAMEPLLLPTCTTHRSRPSTTPWKRSIAQWKRPRRRTDDCASAWRTKRGTTSSK